jgi:hypothetical protein
LWQIRNRCEEGKDGEKLIEGEIAVELSEIIECPDLESFLNLIGEKLAGPAEVLMSQEYSVEGHFGDTIFLKVSGDASAMLEYDEPTEKCQNCGNLYLEDELSTPIKDLTQRVAPGEPMPSGECLDPECRALCQPIPQEQ